MIMRSMIKTEEQSKLEQRAREIGQKDKRLSWDTCMKKAKQELRRFNYNRL